MRILGLDLGITSIGWALTEQPNASVTDVSEIKLINWGSRIFEPGMAGTKNDIDTGKGVSRSVERRLARSLRHQYQRRRQRKKELIRIMTEAGFLPKELTPAFFIRMDAKLLSAFPKEDRRILGHVIPYLYRKMALNQDLLPEELGRAIYHLAQRRGYKSNRKKALKENEEEKGKVLQGIQTLKADMAEKGARTLGEYFCMLDPEEERIRGRYTERSMYEHEFHLICERQRKLVSEELEKKLYKAIFFQRKLKSIKGLIGSCQFEPEEKRCTFACEEAQLYRLYTSIDNLRIQKGGELRKLTDAERAAAIEILNGYTDKLDRSGKISLSALGKELHLLKGEKFTLGDEEKNIYGNTLHSMLFYVFGEASAKMPPDEQAKFWHDLNSIEKEETLQRRLESYWKLTEEQVRKAMTLSLPDDYCSLSLKALRTILPDLEAGLQLRKVLELHYPNNFKPSNNELAILPAIDYSGIELRNPVVHRTLTELQKVVNAIINRYGKPDYIRIELARDLKNTNKEKERITKQNREKEKERETIIQQIIKEVGIASPTRNDILKVQLAEECGFECPYTGKHFSMAQLFDGNTVQIEHIIPFSRSFDDSYRNKTLCMASENGRKSNRTPYEAYTGEEYKTILTRVSHFKGPFRESKLQLFETKEFSPDDFLKRNLNDTRYASRLAMNYLGLLYGGAIDRNGKRRIQACSGGCTALIRRAWGANYLLGDGEKKREDHRHHAIDALTIAIITPEMVKMVANISKDEYKRRHMQSLPILDDALYLQAEKKIDTATVSPHIINKIGGPMHDETFYSNDGQMVYKRVKLSAMSPDDVLKIRDKAIRIAVYEAMGLKDGDPVTNTKLAVFKDEKNYPTLKDANGKAVNVIKSVKVACKLKNTRAVGKGDSQRYVNPNNNYLLAVYATCDAAGNEIEWSYKVLCMLDACQRMKQGLPLVDKNLPGLKFKFSLRKGDIVSLKNNGKEELYVIRAFSESDNRVACVPINDAREKKQLSIDGSYKRLPPNSAMKVGMVKYTMNIFGELRRAND